MHLIVIVLCLGIISLGGGCTLLQWSGNPGNPLWWLAAGGLTLALVLWRIAVAFTKEPRDLPVAFFPGLANRLTILRGILLCGFTGFLFLELPGGIFAWIPGVLFGAFLLLDCFDGCLARRRSEISAFGAFLDRDLDGMGTLAGILLIISYERVPAWYILPGSAYYVFGVAQWMRQKLGQPLYPLPPSRFRRYASVLQSVFILLVLLPIPLFPGTGFAAALFAMPVVAGFLRDWRSVAGCDRRRPAD